MIDLNALRELVVTLAAAHGVRRQEMENSWNEEKGDLDWQMNYKKDLNSRLQRYLTQLSGFSEVCEMARKDGDGLAMRAALMDMRLYAMNVASEFDALAEDVGHIMAMEYCAPGSQRFPDPYRYPECYREAFPDLNFDA
ncbi:hypothetical protein [Cupriavidus sp. BIS7]|uniref:hypothetical protein n=1 Tax=Cupriavidus sp. BIS7 TaxID=1217718 RepID=UPI0003053D3A|nr:hypothetical protein [Cupriavidus sp. BIS7]